MENEEEKAGSNQVERVLIAVIFVALAIIIGIPLYRGAMAIDVDRMVSYIAPITVFAIFSGLVGSIIWHVSNNRTERHRIQTEADLMNRMIEKFDSPEAFVSFLDSPVGQRVLDGVYQDGQTGRKRIHNSVSEFQNDGEAVSNTF